MITENIKVFLAASVGSIAVWWGINALGEGITNVFFAYEMRTNPAMLAAAAAQLELERELQEAYPLAQKGREPFEIQAKAAFALYAREDNTTKILFQKDGEAPFPIASITKLMTALVVIENSPPAQHVTITKEILETSGEAGQLQEGDVLPVKDLLYLTLLESSNDAVVALATLLGEEQFVAKMNEEAMRLTLQSTRFINPTGLDEPEGSNESTARDLAQFAHYLLNTHPQIFDILSQSELPLYAPEDRFHHLMRNTHELLGDYDWPARILGGKTGITSAAGQTLLFVVESPDRRGYIINVILGSENRFGEMRRLLQWILDSYQWEK